jgi:hypothetical protein
MFVVFLFFVLFCVFFLCFGFEIENGETQKKKTWQNATGAWIWCLCFFESTRELYEHFIAVCLAGVWEYEKQNTYLRLLEAWRRASISFFVLVSKKNLGKKLYGGEKSHSRVFGLFFLVLFLFCLTAKKRCGEKEKGTKGKGCVCLAYSPVVTWW